MIKKLFVAFLAMLLSTVVFGQMVDPVHFTSRLVMGQGVTAEIVFEASIDPGWHVYSTDLGKDGPIAATFNVVKMEGAEVVGKLAPRGKELKQFDNMFGMELRFFEQKAACVQKIRFTKPQYDIDCYLEYGACNDEMCLPPSEVEFKASSNLPLKGEAIEAAEKGKQPDPLVKKEETKEVTADTVALIEIPTEDTTAVDSAIVDSATVTPLPL
jgi:thiol:disulfide interchange protein DsbD